MDIRIGTITHYYTHIGVAVMDINADLKVGDTILILGHTTDFAQKIESMEIEHQKVQSVEPGMEVAIKVDEPVRKGDAVFKAESG